MVTAIMVRILTDPGLVKMMSNKLTSLIGTPTHYIASLPNQVKLRIKALKKLQVEYFKLHGQFYREAAELEHRFYIKYDELMSKRRDIVEGKHEPDAGECEYKEPNEELAADLSKVTIDDASVTGVPSFWLTCMKNVADGIHEFVMEDDEPILEHLTDVVVEDNIDSFKLHFHFSPNEYFSNTILTKEFKLKLAPTDEDPFNFDGPEIVAMKGMKIDWKSDDKNVTQRKISKKQKNKKTGTTRTVTKTVQTDSFFNFFSHPEWIEDSEDMEEDLAETFHADITLGSFFRERLVPRAVLYFTGELAQFDEYDEEEIDEELDEVDEDADPEADPDFRPSKKALRKAAAQQQECKQQ
ncbi:nucleosome assembly protein 1-like 1 isoform X3 [Varroa jacobsoni]|uniref:Nucleosome assembly protein 1-like 1 n=1 Tax=Varroa destructor TaxID=109461 RepID=A0A7M7JXZ6_VARDE|nr:nucleosome assembly protein 1-like 1 isoform X3 [Varroa destructor]XP_022705630.1 nucleosome assembly protein 1-like 1 isoform X3 [Varroa jacobsoni]